MAQTVHAMAWREGVVVRNDSGPKNLDADEVTALIHDPQLLTWIDLVDPGPEDLSTLAAELGLAPTAIDTVRSPLERPKVTRHDSHLFFITYATGLVSGSRRHHRLALTRVAGFVLPTALITIRAPGDWDITPVIETWNDNADLLRHGPGALVHGLLDRIVDEHFQTIQELDDELEELEDALFEERATDAAFVHRVYVVRKDLVRLRRVVLPMREVVSSLLRHRHDDPLLGPWYDDLYDHVLRAAEWTESLRDMVTSVFETNLSLQDARLNTVMKKLAGWAAIIAVPTAVTGWFGQNVPYPGFSHVSGLLQSVVLIVGLSIGLYVLFRRRDWL
jgi:magnesium transporter